MAEYAFLFADALTGALKEEMPLKDVKFSSLLNGSGSFFASLPTHHPKATAANVSEGNTIIYVVRNQIIVWAGLLWETLTSGGSNSSTITIYGKDLFSYFEDSDNRGMYIWHDLSYENVDQLSIARALITYAQSSSIKGPQANLNILTGTELTTDNGNTQKLRTRNYLAHELRNVGDAITQLAALKTGFDFRIDTNYEAGVPVSRFRLFYPSVGTALGMSLELGKNILGYTQMQEAQSQARRVIVTGQGEGDLKLTSKAEDTVYTSYPMREATFSLGDISEQATLDAHAEAQLQRVRQPRRIPTLVVKSSDPEVGSFVCGDTMNVKIDDGFVQLNQPYKLVQYEVRLDEDGSEEMTFRFNDPEVIRP